MLCWMSEENPPKRKRGRPKGSKNTLVRARPAKKPPAKVGEELQVFDPKGAIDMVRSAYNRSGQPTRVLTEYGVELVRVYRAQGLSQRSIAALLNTSHRTLSQIKKRQPEVAEAFDWGTGRFEADYVYELMRQFKSGNTVAGIWAAKNILNWKDNADPPPAQANITVHMIKPMSNDEWDNMQNAGQRPGELLSANPIDTSGETSDEGSE
jgi:transcriptional regulator with XRE-family HTH domain